ncbi:transcriptional regulator [Lactobacillus acidophilus]|uniref:flavodoxin family protein n=1 Tax=Lactobacillus acidophilus TaxID=1579 RepID=UPI0021A7AEA2|nr:flavodoxin [Lactobacillus acidophilus]MCT3602692.1 transcriptional regulator [Lactobacillus acidophilus]MCT3623882.1 transcriptional regulator [Lactobacillus acidophilus]
MGLKVLIAYYSWSGNTKKLADQVVETIPVNTELELRVPEGTFNNDMYQTFDIAKKQIAEKQYPTIQNLDLDPNQYDLILVGSPVWGGMPATPIHTFLDKIQDFKGKVATFYTDAGTVGNYEQVFKEWAQGLNVVKVLNRAADVEDLIRK